MKFGGQNAGARLRHILMLSTGLMTLAASGVAFADDVVVAQNDQAQSNGGIEQVIVTAQKKEERLQDVPVPVTVLKGDDLAEVNQTRFEDYVASVPGLNLARNGGFAGGSMLEIRGLGTSAYTDGSAPTIGFSIDGVPYGPSQLIPIGNGDPGFPDIDPSDIQRIEVLKGPQGTLYGANTLGGLINIITKDPSTTEFQAHVQGLGEDIPNGGAGYALRGSANVPVTDDLAVRVSAFDRRDPGYIDNALSGQKNVNYADVFGAHATLLYTPIENLSFKFSALLQENHANASSVINVNQDLQPQLPNLEQTAVPGAGNDRYQTQAYTGTINAQVAGVAITSITGYTVQSNKRSTDFTQFFSSFVDSYFTSTSPNAVTFPSNVTNRKFSQEIRLSSSYSHWLDWIVGGFYAHEINTGVQSVNANNPVTGAYVGSYWYDADGRYGDPPSTFSQQAIFGDLTFHLSDQFDLQGGIRESWYQEVFNYEYFGPGYTVFGGTPQPEPPPSEKGSDSALTYLITPAYKVSQNLMVYSRIATGYQTGGVNDAAAPDRVYGPSKTINYEVGTKGTLADGRLAFDASVYYIDWADMQVDVSYDRFGNVYYTNIGRAKSEGIEASLQAEPIDGLRVTAVGAYNDADLVKSFPTNATLIAPAGTQLPWSTHWSGALSAEMDVLDLANTIGFVGGRLNYVGVRPGDFDGEFGVSPRLKFPAYTTLDAHVGLRDGKLEALLYVKNLGNARGFSGGGTAFGAEGNTAGFYANVIQPRTVGLSISTDF